jgi:hypothetical protein
MGIVLTRWYTYLWFGQVHWIHRKSGLLLGIVFWRIVNHCKPLKKNYQILPRYCMVYIGYHWFMLNPSESIAISLPPVKKSNDFPSGGWKKTRWIPFERDRREHVLGKANFGYVSLVKQYFLGKSLVKSLESDPPRVVHLKGSAKNRVWLKSTGKVL